MHSLTCYSCYKGHTKFVFVLQIFVQARPKLFLVFQFDVLICMNGAKHCIVRYVLLFYLKCFFF